MKRLYGIALSLLFVSCSLAVVTKRGPYITSQSAFASAASITWTHIQPAVSDCPNNILIAVCGNDASTITSIKYNGSPLTSRAALTSTETSQIWTLTNSTITGANSLVATFGGAVNGICGAVTFCGADVTTPSDATNTSQATSVDPTIAVTVVSSGAWIVDSMFDNATTLTENRTNNNVAAAVFASGGPSSLASHINGPFGAGSNTIGWTQSTSAAWTKVAMSIKPSTGTPIVVTNDVTTISTASATGNCTILNNGGNAISAQGACVSTHPYTTTADTCFSTSGTPASVAMSALTPGTGYYARCYATNSEGTDYGSDFPFRTSTLVNGAFVNLGVGNSSMTMGVGSIQAN